MALNRRNFIGNLLAATAGFAILPAAKTHSRIWVPDRQVIPVTVQSIWQTHRITYNHDAHPVMEWPFRPSKLGEITTVGNSMFYGTSDGWVQLVPMRRQLPWTAGQHSNWNPWVFV
jgi:hypothetical protein